MKKGFYRIGDIVQLSVPANFEAGSTTQLLYRAIPHKLTVRGTSSGLIEIWINEDGSNSDDDKSHIVWVASHLLALVTAQGS